MATQRVQIAVSFQYETTVYVAATPGGSASTAINALQAPPVTSVSIVDANTNNPVTVYQGLTGTATIASPQTDTGGNVPGYVVEGFYKLTAAAAGSFSGATVYWNAVRGDGVENVAAGAINSAQIANGAVGNAQLASGLFQSTLPAGAIINFGGTSAPAGFLMCDGSVVSQTTYNNLYAVIGTAFNTGGEGAGNFRLPDLRQRFVLGKAASGTGSTLGATGGAIDHTHSIPGLSIPSLALDGLPFQLTLPNHTHGLTGAAVAIALEEDPNGKATMNFYIDPHATVTHNFSHKHLADLIDIPVNVSTTNAKQATQMVGNADAGGGGTFANTTSSGSTHTGTTGTGITGTNNPPYLVLNKLIKF
jgi:microcystin-dependent protein